MLKRASGVYRGNRPSLKQHRLHMPPRITARTLIQDARFTPGEMRAEANRVHDGRPAARGQIP
jgi:hypothetical protein